MVDHKGVTFGTCRTPGSSCSASDSGAACPDVHGVYSVDLDTASSSAQCTKWVSNTHCTVTENACSLAWSCTPNNGFMTSTLDSSGRSNITLPAQGGTSATCALAFSSGSFTWDCQFTGGTAIDCKGTGTLQ